MICTRKFWIIFIITLLLLLFGVHKAHVMASETTPKYPYVERVEVGYKVKPFEVRDTVKYYKPSKASKKKEEDNKAFENLLKCFSNSLGCAIVFYCLCGIIIFFILALTSAISLGIALVIRNKNIAKKS